MKMNKASYIPFFSFFILVALIGATAFLFGYRTGVKNAPVIIDTKIDTTFVHDSIEIEKPVPVFVRTIDSIKVLVAVHDTATVHDSVMVTLPREEKVYQDSTYYAVVSGFMPSLDSLTIYRDFTQITVTNTVQKKTRHFGFGAAFGPTATVDFNGTFHVGIGATIGVVYKF